MINNLGTAVHAPPHGGRRLVAEWFLQLVDYRLRQVSWPSIEPHRDYVAAQLAVGVRVATVHQRLRDEHGLDASVASVRRWVAANLPEQARRAQVTVLRDTPPPGEQAQIDYAKMYNSQGRRRVGPDRRREAAHDLGGGRRPADGRSARRVPGHGRGAGARQAGSHRGR